MTTERKIASVAKRLLKNDLLNKIQNQFSQRTGDTFNHTDVTSRFSKGLLARIIIKAPKHLFIQTFGFEGVKSNGVSMRLIATHVVDDAIDNTDVVNFLADKISEVRAESVMVNFR